MTKETSDTRLKRHSIFLYTPPNIASYKATVINRNRYLGTDHLHLFFNNLKMTGSMNKAGTAKFTVTDLGDATDDERGLLVAGTYVAIVAGYDVIWTGKVLRAVQNNQCLYDISSGSRFKQWDVECESDISKMRNQTVNPSSKGHRVDSAGAIVSTLVARNTAGDVNWNGDYESGIISNEGATIQYNITDADMYEQFASIAELSGFDWRTRFLTWIGQYDSWNGTDTVTVADYTDPYPADAWTVTAGSPPHWIGRWCLFVHDTNADASTNKLGVMSYGRITDNDTTTITLSDVVNGAVPPAADSNVIVLVDPVLDFAWGLAQETPIQTMYMFSARDDAAKYYGYAFNDKSDKKTTATKIVAKGKCNIPNGSFILSAYTPSGTGVSDSISVALAAKDDWDETLNKFKKSSFITFKMDGYIYSYTANATTLKLIGQGYALKSGDVVYAYGIDTNGVVYSSASATITGAPTTNRETDGTDTTTLTFLAALDASHSYTKYSVLIAKKTYVESTTDISAFGSAEYVYMGAEMRHVHAVGVDTTYGPYLEPGGAGDFGANNTPIYPHIPGCLVSLSAYSGSGGYSESSPNSASPVGVNGILIETVTVDQAVTMSELDIYATQALINKSYYVRKATCWFFLPDFTKPGDRGIYQAYFNTLIREGDKLAVYTNADEASDPYAKSTDGQYLYQWMVSSWTFDTDEMRITVELGTYEQSVYNLLFGKTSATNRTLT